jgi:hypothetical protein
VSPILYHYTCGAHGLRGIEREGVIKPRPHRLLTTLPPVVWLTDLAQLDKPDVVGLTMETLTCDRTEHRLRVSVADAEWWPLVTLSSPADRSERRVLEYYGQPTHWWISKALITDWQRS